LRQGKRLVTIHDLSFLRYPEGAEPSLRRYLSAAVPRSVDQADLILADSESTRRDVVELLGTPPSKVEVLYPGLDEAFQPVEDAGALTEVRELYSLGRPFLLTVGTLEPRKNTVTLLEAYATLIREKDFEHQLVIGGGLGWRYEGIFSRVTELSLEDRISFLNYVPEEHLPALYTLADVFVFPSLYEGFGLPPLEAMACGTPVVASDTSSLPEVIGDAGLMVPAQDTGALAEAIKRTLEDSDLSRVTRFSWQASGERLIGIYRRLCEN
jgi:glycosyltransferase involved in cell wall biosynthesis